MICFYCRKSIRAANHYGLHLPCFIGWFGLELPAEFAQVAMKEAGSQSPISRQFSNKNTSFFAGKFKKYSADLGEHSYILKVQMGDYPELPYAEFLSNQLAGEMGILVPDFYLIRFGEVPTFVSRNFVSKKGAENLVHIYRYLPASENAYNCENLIKTIERETGSPKESRRFVDLCLFDSLIGNHDRHGRNLAILETPTGKRVAPFYDNPSNLGIEDERFLGAQLSPRGKIATTKTDEPTMKDYVREFIRLSRRDQLIRFYGRVKEPRLFKLIDSSFVSEKRKAAFKKLIRQRYQEMRDALE